MATTAQFIGSPRSAAATISTANTAFDGTGTIVTVFTAGAAGARIERVVIEATATSTAGLVNLFFSTDSAANTAANTHLYDNTPIAAVTPSATVAPASAVRSNETAPQLWPLILGPGQTLRASTTVANSLRVTAVGGDY
jgi:hypothetical protein